MVNPYTHTPACIFMHQSHSHSNKSKINSMCHEASDNISFDISIIEAIAAVIHVDPCETSLHLDEFVDFSILVDKYNEDGGEDCLNLSFNYGGYLVDVCMCGCVMIFANEDEYIRGEVALPHSMSGYTEQTSPETPSSARSGFTESE